MLKPDRGRQSDASASAAAEVCSVTREVLVVRCSMQTYVEQKRREFERFCW